MKNIRELDNISSSKKRIPLKMTDEEWQEYFSELRKKIKPSSEHLMKTSYSIWVNGYKDISYFTYHSDTEWQYYCKFINSVLRTIRGGECDYCYHIYQISDLLRFEHDKLKTLWIPNQQCFEVSLELNQ